MGTRAEEHDDFLVITTGGDLVGIQWFVNTEQDKDIVPGSKVVLNEERLGGAVHIASGADDGIGRLFRRLLKGEVLEVREVVREVLDERGVPVLPTFSSSPSSLPDEEA